MEIIPHQCDGRLGFVTYQAMCIIVTLDELQVEHKFKQVFRTHSGATFCQFKTSENIKLDSQLVFNAQFISL